MCLARFSPQALIGRNSVGRNFLAFGAVLLLCCGASVAAADENKDDTRIDDGKIATAIEGELWGAKGVNANPIDIEVNQGIVTISGKVNNAISKDAAVRIAKMTKGVRAVVNRLEVKPEQRTNAEISRDVLNALAHDPATDSWEIRNEVKNGIVTLEGSVQSYAERQLAEKVAKSVRGVKTVQNNISVDYQTDRADYEVKQDIVQRLNWDVRLDDELISVQVNDGRVTLSGSVGSDYEKSLARADAWIAGVTSVDDDKLTVEWWSRDGMQRKKAWSDLDDDEIKQAVKEAFLYDPRVFSFNPDVTVENGVVTLTGVVDNLKARRAAAQDAKNTVGVWRVKNYLKVRPLEDRPNEAIENDVRDAFLRDPWVNRFEITVNAYDGEVYLYGDVDSYFEKEQAEDLASKVNGVTDVHNYLTVSYSYPDYDYNYYDWDPTLYDFDFDYDYKTTRTKPDREIKEQIESEIWWSPWVDADEVNVAVEDGVATLTGTVDSWSERDKAAENAIEGGAVKVVNRLDVQYR